MGLRREKSVNGKPLPGLSRGLLCIDLHFKEGHLVAKWTLDYGIQGQKQGDHQ